MSALGKKIEVSGIPLACEWDSIGGVKEIRFYANGEKLYEVCRGGKAEKLFKLIQHPVLVSGNIIKTKEGIEALFVRKVSKIEIKGDFDEEKGA